MCSGRSHMDYCEKAATHRLIVLDEKKHVLRSDEKYTRRQLDISSTINASFLRGCFVVDP